MPSDQYDIGCQPSGLDEVPLDISCSLEDLKSLAAKMEVSIPVDETHLEVEKEYLDQTMVHHKKKKKKKLNPAEDAAITNGLHLPVQPPKNSSSSPAAAAAKKKVTCKLCNVQISGGCEEVVRYCTISLSMPLLLSRISGSVYAYP